MRIASSEMSCQMDGVLESNNEAKRKWGFPEIAIRAPLKPIFTKPASTEGENEEEEEEEATTPTSEDSKIISSRFLTCPPAPKKRKASSKLHRFTNDVRRRNFVHVPDLEAVFISCVTSRKTEK